MVRRSIKQIRPYNMMPSKNRTFPMGVLNRNAGSGTFGNRLNTNNTTIKMARMINRQFRGESQRLKLGVIIVFISALLSTFCLPLQAKCVGRFVNPITDICWKCVFPITIMGMDVARGNPSPPTPRNPICICNRPPLNQPTPGIPIGFWEPVRLVDVTRTPYCLVNMGGMQLAGSGLSYRGDVQENPDDATHHSFYQVHWYIYPVMYWLEVLTDFACMENASIDLAYLTELDPLWNDDEKSFILNPEAVLFGNVLAQAACAGDCVAASSNLPLDSLFWCSGCQGGLYPFTGTLNDHSGGVQASLLITGRFMAKLHREALLWGTFGVQGLCSKYPMPIIKKSQYRLQMTFPIPSTNNCYPLGHTEVLWQGGKEFPYQGSDFGYLVWRRRDCCLL
jgi:conjugal transfer pilus assembly protein TraU